MKEKDLIEQMEAITTCLKKLAEPLKEDLSEKEGRELNKAIAKINQFSKTEKESQKEDFFHDTDYESPDMDRIQEAVEEKGESFVTFMKTNEPEVQEYLDNVNLWMELDDKKDRLLKQLNAVKRQQKEVLKKCRNYENNVAPEKLISQSKAMIQAFLKMQASQGNH